MSGLAKVVDGDYYCKKCGSFLGSTCDPFASLECCQSNQKFEIGDVVSYYGSECIVRGIDQARNRYFIESLAAKRIFWVDGGCLDEF